MVVVEPELVIGRSPGAGLQLHGSYVSGQHATLRWIGERWELKDLGSRNGTLLNGTRLVPGRTYPVTSGDHVAFGHTEEAWQLSSNDAPAAMAIPLDGGNPCVAVDDVLGLPTGDAPLASVHRDSDGAWRLENETGDVRVLTQQARFEVGGREYRFCFPELSNATATADHVRQRASLALEFAVSRDEEHVELRAIGPSGTIDLGSRSHNYLLLTLARVRLRDALSGQVETSAGWTFQDDLLKALLTTQMQLNIDVFRIRQHFARAGLQEVADIIQRRPRTKQLRIGVAALHVRTL